MNGARDVVGTVLRSHLIRTRIVFAPVIARIVTLELQVPAAIPPLPKFLTHDTRLVGLLCCEYELIPVDRGFVAHRETLTSSDFRGLSDRACEVDENASPFF